VGHAAFIRDGYLEVVFSGVLSRETVAAAGGLNEEQTEAARKSQRILFNFDDVTEFSYDPFALGLAMARLAGNLRLAICSSNPALFGVGRQIAQYSGVEGEAMAVFTDRIEALGWLLEKVD